MIVDILKLLVEYLDDPVNDRLGVLADKLEDAGCNTKVLRGMKPRQENSNWWGVYSDYSVICHYRTDVAISLLTPEEAMRIAVQEAVCKMLIEIANKQ